jgi:hypothetical protein
MYSFAQSLLTVYPELRGREILLAGESYAGHYIPAIAEYVLSLDDDDDDVYDDGGFADADDDGADADADADAADDAAAADDDDAADDAGFGPDWPLPIGGLALGNPWSDPRTQYNYAQFAWNVGLISSATAAALDEQYDEVQFSIER